MQPQISVIVPVYKAEKYLHRCIDSILAQTFTDFELILVDDGSPDGSGAICDEYAQKDKRVKVIHKENGGVSSARNAGLDKVIGKWVTFIDADDYIEQGFFNIPEEATEDLLIQNYKFFGDNDKVVCFQKKIIKEVYIPEFLNENLHKEWLRAPWAKFYKTDIIKNKNIYFPLNIKIGEDALYIQEYLHYTKSVNFIATSQYMYKCDDDYKRYKLPVEDSLKIFHKFIDNYKKLNIHSKPFLDFAFNFYWGLIAPQNNPANAKLWYNDSIVKDIYKSIYRNRGLKWWIKYNLYKLKS